MDDEDDGARIDLRRRLQDHLEQTIEARIDRYLQVRHQGIIPSHHFAAASSECVDLYRDGYFLSAVMVSQSVNEGIWRFLLERNGVAADRPLPDLAPLVVARGLISQGCADALVRIWQSFRNDVHHMNPKVASVPFELLASRNLADLAVIERELFAVDSAAGGMLRPVNPKYWDLQPDGLTTVYLRL